MPMPAKFIPTTTVVPEGEVPTWKSPNELIHERVNFDDTIWGFGLAGGAYYKCPLRVTYVRPDSRGDKAHILPGDIVLKINGIDSSTLTVEEAHRMIVESGIHLQLNVTSPDDTDEGYYCYQDPLEAAAEEEAREKARKKRETPRPPKPSGKCSHWSLQWPWKSKKKTIYKESNCYLVPSKFEEKHKDTRKPPVKQDDTIVLDSIYSAKGKARKNETEPKENVNDINSLQNNKSDSKLDDSVGKNKDEVITEENDSKDEKDEGDVNGQKVAKDDVDKDTIAINKPSVHINNDVGESDEKKSVEKIDKDGITESINPVIESNENSASNTNSSEHNNPLDKINENIITDHNSAADGVEKDGNTDENISVDKSNDGDETDHNTSLDAKRVNEEHVEFINETNEGVNNELNNPKEEQEGTEKELVKPNDLKCQNNVNIERAGDQDIAKVDIIENSDIPGMNESEKLL